MSATSEQRREARAALQRLLTNEKGVRTKLSPREWRRYLHAFAPTTTITNGPGEPKIAN